MKYYFPTSTLNFDAIASAMCIMSVSLYREGAVGFSLYTRTKVDVLSNSTVLYSCPLTWTTQEGNSINYPMLIEIDDEDGLLSIGERLSLEGEISGIRLMKPYYFSASNIVSKKIRFIFRTMAELELVVDRARSNVAEYKALGTYEALQVDSFALISTLEGTREFESLGIENTLKNFDDLERSFAWEEYVKRDRADGANAGFRAGQWVHALNTGRFCDSLRQPITFEVWRESLSPEFNALIDMLCGDSELRWDVNRKAVVEFCARCWNECLSDSHNEVRHEILRNIARSVADTTYAYPIRDIQDPEMQALACFIVAGKRDGVLVNLMKTENVRLPELVLALHGALIGYSVLSRTLFEKRSFADEQKSTDDENRAAGHCVEQKASAMGVKSVVSAEERAENITHNPKNPLVPWVKRFWDAVKVVIGSEKKSESMQRKLEGSAQKALAECASERELMTTLPKKYKKDGWGPKRFDKLQKLMAVQSSGMPKEVDLFDGFSGSWVTDQSLLVCDAGLSAALAKEFADMGAERVGQLRKEVQKFSDKYTNGYYGENPQDYAQSNPDIIDHMMRCFHCVGFAQLDFAWKSDEEDRFVKFLEDRYHCKRKVNDKHDNK